MQGEKYSFHASTVGIKMASPITSHLTSDETSSESVWKYPVLFDKSCCDLKNKLRKQKQMAWAEVASEVGLQNGKCCDTKGKYKLKQKTRPDLLNL